MLRVATCRCLGRGFRSSMRRGKGGHGGAGGQRVIVLKEPYRSAGARRRSCVSRWPGARRPRGVRPALAGMSACQTRAFGRSPHPLGSSEADVCESAFVERRRVRSSPSAACGGGCVVGRNGFGSLPDGDVARRGDIERARMFLYVRGRRLGCSGVCSPV